MRTVERIVTITLLLVLGAVYASAQQPAVITDIQKLAGKWSAWGTGSSGSAFPIEVVVKPDGTYTSMMGAVSGHGRFRLVDCKVTGVSTEGHLSGPAGAGTPTVSDAGVGTKGGKRVLSGVGRTDAGPFNYDLTKQ